MLAHELREAVEAFTDDEDAILMFLPEEAAQALDEGDVSEATLEAVFLALFEAHGITEDDADEVLEAIEEFVEEHWTDELLERKGSRDFEKAARGAEKIAQQADKKTKKPGLIGKALGFLAKKAASAAAKEAGKALAKKKTEKGTVKHTLKHAAVGALKQIGKDPSKAKEVVKSSAKKLAGKAVKKGMKMVFGKWVDIGKQGSAPKPAGAKPKVVGQKGGKRLVKRKRKLREELAGIVEWEASVDDEGYAYDDEGNRWFVGKQYAGGTYGLGELPMGGDDGGRRRAMAHYGRDELKALDDVIKKRPNDFLKSLRRQMGQGYRLSAKQKGAAIKILERMGEYEASRIFGGRGYKMPRAPGKVSIEDYIVALEKHAKKTSPAGGHRSVISKLRDPSAKPGEVIKAVNLSWWMREFMEAGLEREAALFTKEAVAQLDRLLKARSSGKGAREPEPAPRAAAGHKAAGTDEKLAVLDAALKKRDNSFLRSIRDQVARGRKLSDKQAKAVRQNLHRLRMHDESKLFKEDVELHEVGELELGVPSKFLAGRTREKCVLVDNPRGYYKVGLHMPDSDFMNKAEEEGLITYADRIGRGVAWLHIGDVQRRSDRGPQEWEFTPTKRIAKSKPNRIGSTRAGNPMDAIGAVVGSIRKNIEQWERDLGPRDQWWESDEGANGLPPVEEARKSLTLKHIGRVTVDTERSVLIPFDRNVAMDIQSTKGGDEGGYRRAALEHAATKKYGAPPAGFWTWSFFGKELRGGDGSKKPDPATYFREALGLVGEPADELSFGQLRDIRDAIMLAHAMSAQWMANFEEWTKAMEKVAPKGSPDGGVVQRFKNELGSARGVYSRFQKSAQAAYKVLTGKPLGKQAVSPGGRHARSVKYAVDLLAGVFPREAAKWDEHLSIVNRVINDAPPAMKKKLIASGINRDMHAMQVVWSDMMRAVTFGQRRAS